MIQARLKTGVLIFLIGTLLAGLMLPARPARATWSQIPTDIVNRMLAVFTEQELWNAIGDAAKALAMKRWQKVVMKLVAKKGGFIWNYGQYLFGAGDSAASKYWRAFLQNCTNINPTVSMNIQFSGVEQKNYDWCPVRVNVRGVKIQEKIDLSNNFGWEDFQDAMANSSYRQYLQLSANVAEARRDAELVKYLEATSSGNKPATEESDFIGPQEAPYGEPGGQIGPPPEPSDASKEQVKIPVQSFLNLINAATGGVVQVSANSKSIIASAVTTILLEYAADQLLTVYDKSGGQYGEYFR